jgi:ElaB/YqjD/DUF883 family membrane-anchored ribosome-binding protein
MSTNLSYDPATKSEIESPSARISRDLQGVAAVTGVLLKDVASATGEGLASAGSQVRQKLNDAASVLDETRVVALDKAKTATKITEKYVQDHPWKSVGISAVIGLALGILLKRD